jgi:hypothetical protein
MLKNLKNLKNLNNIEYAPLGAGANCDKFYCNQLEKLENLKKGGAGAKTC